MDVKSLKAKIKLRKLPDYMIFSGDEWMVQNIGGMNLPASDLTD